MKLIKLESVIIGDRIRDIDNDHIEELMQSIKDNGLMQPIVLSKDKRLIAGGHRLEAFIRLAGETDVSGLQLNPEYQSIPYIYFEDYLVKVGRCDKGEVISESTLRKLEVEENVRRLDMRWQDQVKAISIYHKLSKQGKANRWSQGMTAKLLGVNQAKVSTALDLASELESGHIPGLEDCSSIQEALKLKLKFKAEMVADEAQRRIDEKREKVLKHQAINKETLEIETVDGPAFKDEPYSLAFARKLFTLEHPDSVDMVVFAPGSHRGKARHGLPMVKRKVAVIFHHFEDTLFYNDILSSLLKYESATPLYWGSLQGSDEELEDGVMIGRIFSSVKPLNLRTYQANNWEMNVDFQDVIERLASMYVPEGGTIYLPDCEEYCSDALARLVLKGFIPFANVDPAQAEDLITETHERLNYLSAFNLKDVL